MSDWTTYSKEELLELKAETQKRYDEYKAKGLKLDLSRGKPGSDVLDLSNGLLGALDTYKSENGTDIRNYGVPTGLPEAKKLFSDLLGIPAANLIVGGNSSLTHMYNVFAFLHLFGPKGFAPWSKQKVKILCPCPGYDRHFTLTDDFGAEMVVVPLKEDGPDMDLVEKLAAEDESVKGIWIIPLYSNPTGGIISSEKAKRLASMKTAAKDFRIFWDNAYGVHHIWEKNTAPDILKLTAEAGNADRAYYFFSTSKINFPGGGIGLVAASEENVAELAAHYAKATIGFDKIIQLKTVKFFGNADGIVAHMERIAELLRPRFDHVLGTLHKEFSGTGLLTWTPPKGGYFVSVDTLPGCAKAVVALAKDAGVVLTGAGATYPHKADPNDSNIRIAPTYPDLDELEETMELLVLCIKLVSIDKLLEV
ncbi:MAG: aminotransferase class I/II-fold pyridoxal phosphate-dependent enzyme [Clostridiales Family XIII bacterium]|jgi:aspartate/methionine/tyrosine aminotransferase|nr:aminotransferase class I/II-fold pyridoxal phosphate-dependent enzyme [Clostridiales Family XIII bacterium]